MTLAYRRPRRATTSALLGLSALTALGSGALLAPAQAAEAPARSVSIEAVETQGIPGQYLLDQGKDGYLWVAGSAGRPPIVTSTLAKVNPETLKIEAVAQLPEARFGTGEGSGYHYLGAYGVEVDNENGNVWVTNTRTNSVSVFRQSDMQLVWTDFNPARGSGTVTHPREVIIDSSAGKAFVSASASVHAFDLKTFEASEVHQPSAAPGRQAKMNLALDEKTHRLFVPDLAGGVVEIYNTQTLDLMQTITLKGNDDSAALRASDVAYDASLNELYVTSQGRDGKNSGVGIYDATSGAFKTFIPFGSQALAVDNDEERDLVYITDFKTGQVGVVDAPSATIVGSVQAGKAAANDVEVLEDGSVVVVNKATYAEDVTVPFTLSFLSGVTQTSNTEVKGAQASPTPITANSIVKFTVTEKKSQADKAPVEEQQTVSTADGATITGLKVLPEGKTIEVTGTGWKHPAGGGSIISVKADRGSLSYENNNVLAEVEADSEGNFKLTLPFPKQANGYNQTWAADGTEHTLHFLTGSAREGDVVRAGVLKVTVGQATVAEEPVEVVTPVQLPFAGYPAATDSDPDNKLIFQASFSDVKKGDMFYDEIMWVGNTGVARGWDDGTYRPLQGIERGAMAAYLYRLAGSPRYVAPETSPFTDVPTDHPFYKEIAWLKATGITRGWEDGTYRPEETINRDAMAAFFYRAAGSPEYTAPTGDVFRDVSQNTAFFKEISWLKEQGITTGWSDGTYRPVTPINRDAMAAFVYRFQKDLDVKVSAQ